MSKSIRLMAKAFYRIAMDGLSFPHIVEDFVSVAYHNSGAGAFASVGCPGCDPDIHPDGEFSLALFLPKSWW